MVSKKKGSERGLAYELRCMEETLKRYRETGRDEEADKLEPIVKSYRKELKKRQRRQA